MAASLELQGMLDGMKLLRVAVLRGRGGEATAHGAGDGDRGHRPRGVHQGPQPVPCRGGARARVLGGHMRTGISELMRLRSAVAMAQRCRVAPVLL